MKRSLLLALPLLAACSGPFLTASPGEFVALPRDAVVGAGDPTRGAVLSTSAVFGDRTPAAGQPAAAARGIAQMEYLAVALPSDANFANASPTLVPQLATARREWRGALDIAPDASPQAVIDSLYMAGRALDAGQRDAAAAALPPALFRRGGAATLAQLAALPNLPNTAAAAATAQQALRTLTPTRVL
ncbi:hypothetical protein EJV46_07070 [Roseococcus sp. SYP-B2431]|uniref:hypothetical protein n=1 Tax=Roseococcus sp. SYP-B2431 TaxID=2496640 RepID=UPI00103EBA16|nr:hypothetical protein [Roseococcus sp. SYP-B2431]TCI00387.1 hypothetical protein EJV46_07070 [Roseococcus sp. SYP-B2431]